MSRGPCPCISTGTYAGRTPRSVSGHGVVEHRVLDRVGGVGAGRPVQHLVLRQRLHADDECLVRLRIDDGDVERWTAGRRRRRQHHRSPDLREDDRVRQVEATGQAPGIDIHLAVRGDLLDRHGRRERLRPVARDRPQHLPGRIVGADGQAPLDERGVDDRHVGAVADGRERLSGGGDVGDSEPKPDGDDSRHGGLACLHDPILHLFTLLGWPLARHL